jgi:hypothetical protein
MDFGLLSGKPNATERMLACFMAGMSASWENATAELLGTIETQRAEIERLTGERDEQARQRYNYEHAAKDWFARAATAGAQRDAALMRIAAAIDVIEGNDGRVLTGNPPKCEHGRFEWEDCIACYDEALTAALTKDTPSDV